MCNLFYVQIFVYYLNNVVFRTKWDNKIFYCCEFIYDKVAITICEIHNLHEMNFSLVLNFCFSNVLFLKRKWYFVCFFIKVMFFFKKYTAKMKKIADIYSLTGFSLKINLMKAKLNRWVIACMFHYLSLIPRKASINFQIQI